MHAGTVRVHISRIKHPIYDEQTLNHEPKQQNLVNQQNNEVNHGETDTGALE